MDAKKIKLERLRLGLSQEKMAKRLGVIARTIRNYESGKTHVPDTVTKLHYCLKRNDMIKRMQKTTEETIAAEQKKLAELQEKFEEGKLNG